MVSGSPIVSDLYYEENWDQKRSYKRFHEISNKVFHEISNKQFDEKENKVKSSLEDFEVQDINLEEI